MIPTDTAGPGPDAAARAPLAVSGRRRLAVAFLVTAWVVCAAHSWMTLRTMHQKYAGREFGDYFMAGLVDAVKAIEESGVPRAFGPAPDLSTYVFQRFNEMLYPIAYQAPFMPSQLRAGDVYVLVEGQAPPVPSRILRDSGYFRVMQVFR